jgi:ectoine hydroxylase-related dioxygenase (phytanoyl-CoA dioxygenase family)
VKTLELDLNKVAMSLARDGFVVVPGLLSDSELDMYRALADRVLLSDRADYPGSERDVGFLDGKDPNVLELMKNPPVREVLVRFLGDPPVFVNAWVRVALPSSPGAPWHQDLQREYWPTPINLAIYLDDVTIDNGPTLVVPGSHTLPHPEFDTRAQPRETQVLGRAGTGALFYATVWHRGSANRTALPRRALFAYFRGKDAIRIRRPPDPAAGAGQVLGSPGALPTQWESAH